MNGISRIHQKKASIVTIFFTIAFLVAILLLFKWQVISADKYIAIAKERYKIEKIPSIRGGILSSDGSTLAYSEPRFDVFVWIPEIEMAEKNGYQSRDEFVSKVSNILGDEEQELVDKLSAGPLWVKIASKATVEQRNRLQDLRRDDNPEKYLRGVQMEYINKRIYPEDNLASHVLGFVGMKRNSKPVGVGGIEQFWEGSLKPIQGFQLGEFDSFGNPITLESETQLEPKPGVTIHTTIDKTLQRILEQKLKGGYEKYQASSATGIIMDPRSGEILALANYPDYNPNEYYAEKDGSVFGNSAITKPYEVGSIAKVFTVASAIDLGKITPDTLVLPQGHAGCEIISPNPEPWESCFDKIDKDTKCICTYDRKANLNPISTARAILDSDNIAIRHISLTMTYEEFHTYLDRFGVGSLTGIGLSGESTGVLKPHENWNYADQAVYSYGHSYQITPLQAVSGFGVIANDGIRMQPYIVSKVVDADDYITEFKPTIEEKVISKSTSEKMIIMMNEVYQANIYENELNHLKKYYIALKSGTALIPYLDRAGYSDEINTTYVGFDASPDRKFVLLIKLERPQVGDLSFYNARVLWLETFDAIKEYLGVKEYSQY